MILYLLKKHTIRRVKSGLLLLFIAAALTFAHSYGLAQERRIEEEKRQSLDQESAKTTVEEDRIVLDYGGWLNFRYDDFYEHDNDSTTPDIYDWRRAWDLRLWFRISLLPYPEDPSKNRHSFYFRLKDAYIDRRYGDESGGGDHDGPHIDYAYLTLDFDPWQIEVGRNYFSLGRGIAYSDVHDGMEITGDIQGWRVKGVVSHTLTHEDNIDTSVPGYAKDSDRYFFGTEARYTLEDNQDIYAFVLVQRDFSNEHPQDAANDYTYDSEYFGLGAKGAIFSNANYWLEVIHQTGQSRIFATREKRDIDAWAVDLGAACDLPIPTHPTLSFEYAYGSGDSSRASVTDTQNGNTSKKDTNFLCFGYLDTGYAVSPELSNIHIYRIGLAWKPLEKFFFLKRLTTKVNYYRYYKDRSAGGISEIEATQVSDDIGSEIDVNLVWQVFSDLNITLQYGYFMPDDAYAEAANDSEEYFSVSTTLKF